MYYLIRQLVEGMITQRMTDMKLLKRQKVLKRINSICHNNTILNNLKSLSTLIITYLPSQDDLPLATEI